MNAEERDAKLREGYAEEFSPCQACASGDHHGCVCGTPGGAVCDCADFGHDYRGTGSARKRYVDYRMERHLPF